MIRSRTVPLALGCCFLLGVTAASPAAAEEPAELTLERIFASTPIGGTLPRGLSWRPGHEQVVLLEQRGEGEQASEVLVAVTPAEGTRTLLLDPSNLAGKDEMAPSLRGFLFSPNGDAVLLPGGDQLRLVDLTGRDVRTLDTTGGRFLTFSPDGGKLAYVRENDLYVYDLAADREIRLTHDGSATVFNGAMDWVYEEELADRNGKAFTFSPAGDAILWLRTDDGAIPPFHLVDLLDTHSRLREQRYPKAGDPAPAVSLHAAWFGNGGTVLARQVLAPPVGGGYLPRFGWFPDGSAVWCQVLDHPQDSLRLVRLALPGGAATILVEERDPHWVEPVDLFRPLPDGTFLWGSRASGFMHLELRGADGRLLRDLTPGRWDVTALVGADAEAGLAWYQAARPTPLQRRIFRVALADGATVEVSPGAGTHSARLSPRHGFLLLRSSRSTQLTRVTAVRSDGSALRTLATLDEEAIESLGLVPPRFVTVRADDGVSLNASLITPPDFDPAGKYPAVIYVYGGPHAQVVRDAWGRSTALFHHWLARQGFVVFALDNRGSFARGREFEGAVDHRLGQQELADQLAGVRWLKAQGFVDPSRIGIWGWSYGGYMTCYALTHAPGVFAAGAAVAPVTDWRLYDSIYTERYMGTPAENPEGYAAGSVLEKVGDLGDALLVIHGTGDDNVHFQNTVQLAERAWRAGKSFDLMLFPNLKHGIRAKGSHLQVFRRIAGHFLAHLQGKGGVPR